MTPIDVTIDLILSVLQVKRKNLTPEQVEQLNNCIIGGFRMYEINGEAEYINDALGISDERMQELMDIAFTKYESFEKAGVVKWSQILIEVSKHVRSSNELMYLGYAIGLRNAEVASVEDVLESPLGTITILGKPMFPWDEK